MNRKPWLVALAALALNLSSAIFAAGEPCVIFGESETSQTATNQVWRTIGPGGGGWVQSMAWSRHVPNRLLVGCDVGGFYVSENGGRSYERRNHKLTDYFVEDIVEHPVESNTIYIGTCSGVFKSTDLGKNWRQLRRGFPKLSEWSYTAPVSRIIINEANPQKMYAATGRPKHRKGGSSGKLLFSSADGGENWSEVAGASRSVLGDLIIDMSVDSRDWRKMLVSTTNGLFRSTDGGASWTASNNGLPTLRTQRLGRSPSNPDIVYVTMRQRGADQTWRAGVYRSSDGGVTWTAKNGGLDKRTGKVTAVDDYECSWYDRIQVHPTDPNTVFIGGASYWTCGVWKTTDGGTNWKQLCGNGIRKDNGWLNFWGLTVTTLAHSNLADDYIAFGTSGMIYATEDGGDTWPQRYASTCDDGSSGSIGMELTCARAIVPDRYRRNRFFIGYMDIGLMITENNGRSMRRSITGIPSSYQGSCFSIAQSNFDTNLCWATFGNWSGDQTGLVAKSIDAGWTWSPCTNAASGWINSAGYGLCAGRIGDSEVLMYYCATGLVRSTDGGNTWGLVSTAALPVADRVSAITFADGVFYIGCKARSGAAESSGIRSVWKSPDGGNSWQRLTPNSLMPGDITSVAVDGDRILFTSMLFSSASPAHAFLSVDGGANWRAVYDSRYKCSAGLFAGNRIVVTSGDDPFHDNPIGDGVAFSDDNGATWKSLNDDLSLLNVSCMAIDAFRPSRLWVGTGGNSVLVRRLP